MIPKQERGSCATFRLAKGPNLRSYHRTGAESYYGGKKKFKYPEPFFFTNILQGHFFCDIFGAEFGLRVDSIVLTI